ncbi:hypothetical protein BDW74DRAFT_186639 [Aspergillus multicolor]|uniref:uncharacterized protein n=1 Tax=Aspergillus multicolor TaxID=41759 RepID=UPI003CCDA7CF
MSPPKPKLAILDDYQGIAAPHFRHLQDRISITHFPSTLDPRDPTQQSQLITRLHDYDIILAMRERTPLSKSTLSNLPNLKLILTTGTRNRAIDTDYCAERGIPVAGTETRGPGVHSTVQHTWALILGLARHVARDDAGLKSERGYWQGSLGMSISGKTLGLVGLGKLGAQVGKIAATAFGMDVIAWSANLTQEKADQVAMELGLERGVFKAVTEKQEFFETADVVSLHYVLSDRSRGVIGAQELSWMKKSAVLVNTSRGPLVDETALLECVERGGIAGVALDVFETEPLPTDSVWRSTRWGRDGTSEVLLTPHMGYGDEQILGWHTKMPVAIENQPPTPAPAKTTTPSSTHPPPTHPDLIRVHRSPAAFASSATSLVSLPPGSLFTKITGTTLSRKAYTSVQISRDAHIELNSDLVYCNHSCSPSVIFDMEKMEVRVVDDKPLSKGDPLTFFYPSSEWEMDQAFECNCGSAKCKGFIKGAKGMGRDGLRGYWVNGFIEELVREEEGRERGEDGQ